MEVPIISGRDVVDGPIALLPESVKGMMMDRRPASAGYGNRAVCRAAVQDVDIVEPHRGREAFADIVFFVLRKDDECDWQGGNLWLCERQDRISLQHGLSPPESAPAPPRPGRFSSAYRLPLPVYRRWGSRAG